jgi:hypothetical protein
MSTDQLQPIEVVKRKYTRDAKWPERPIRKGRIYDVALEQEINKGNHTIYVFTYKGV